MMETTKQHGGKTLVQRVNDPCSRFFLPTVLRSSVRPHNCVDAPPRHHGPEGRNNNFNLHHNEGPRQPQRSNMRKSIWTCQRRWQSASIETHVRGGSCEHVNHSHDNARKPFDCSIMQHECPGAMHTEGVVDHALLPLLAPRACNFCLSKNALSVTGRAPTTLHQHQCAMTIKLPRPLHA